MKLNIENIIKVQQNPGKILEYLDGVVEHNGYFMAKCPAHDDNNPSLQIKVIPDDKVLMHCFAGCSIEEVLGSLGLKKEDLYFKKSSNKPRPKIDAIYDYEDRNSELLFQVVRLKPKSFYQRRPDGKGGWVNNIKGIEPVIYGLPQVLRAIQNGVRVWIVEGEKDVGSMAEQGLTATTAPMGAGKWKKSYNEVFRNAEVVIIPDNDKVGKEHAVNIARNLYGIASSIKILELDGLKEKGDVSDWFNAGNRGYVLKEFADQAEEWKPLPLEELKVNQDNHTSSSQVFSTCSDLGNAERFVAMHGSDVRYCYQKKKWLIWSGRCWRWDETGEIIRKAKETVRSIYGEANLIEDDKKRKEVAEWAISSEAESRIKAIISLAQSEPGIPITQTQLDINKWLINCLNGTIDLKNGKLREHRRDDYITKLAPVEYVEGAKSEILNKFLETILPDNELREFVKRAAGYSITGDTGEEKLFFAYGPPATGKSTFLAAISSVLGEYSSTADFETFLARDKGASGPRNDIARLVGQRFVLGSEVDEGKKLAEALVKQITGGDVITARFLHQEHFEFIPEFKLWLAANFRPRVSDSDEAMWRRILQIPFTRQIPENERDPRVKASLRNTQETGPAILAWLVEGCLKWQSEGLGVPPVVKEFTEDYRNEMNPLKDFLADCCIINRLAKVKNDQLWREYEEWCRDNGERYPLGRKHFKQKLEAYGFNQSRNGMSRYWNGIGLASDRENTAYNGKLYSFDKNSAFIQDPKPVTVGSLISTQDKGEEWDEGVI